MNKRKVGSSKEDEAARFLIKNGLLVIEKNYLCHLGEIDIIAKDADYLVFVEVKYKKMAGAGHPEEAVTMTKAGKISRTAANYMLRKKYPPETKVRFDVVAIEGDEIRWHKNAFEFMP